VTAQKPPVAPTKPTVARPVAPKPAVVERAKPAAPSKAATLQNELKAVDLEIAKLAPRRASKDSLSEMGKDDQAQLKSLMMKKGELERIISSLMKAGNESSQPLAANSKGS
jgi:hypothetical protein